MHKNIFIKICPHQATQPKEGESTLPNPSSSNNLSSNVYSEKNKTASDDENALELNKRIRNNTAKIKMDEICLQNYHFNDDTKITTVHDIFKGQTPRL